MNLAEKIRQYTPNDGLLEKFKDNPMLFMVGISGAGKDTIKKRLLEDNRFYDFISYTTRKPRENYGVMEQDGVEYHYRSLDDAEKMIDQGEFIEVKEYAGNLYGTAFKDLEQATHLDKLALTDLEVKGVAEYKKYFSNVIAIFVMPPSFNEWQRRLKTRYTPEEFKEVWPKRREAAIYELEHALEVPYYHFIINDDIDEAVDAVMSIAFNHDHFTRKDDEIRLLARDMLDTIKANS